MLSMPIWREAPELRSILVPRQTLGGRCFTRWFGPCVSRLGNNGGLRLHGCPVVSFCRAITLRSRFSLLLR